MQLPINFNRLVGIAIARLRISSLEFYDLCPAEFYEAITYLDEKEKAELEFQRNNIWEAMRYQTMFWYNTQVKRTQRVSNPQELFRFFWEKEEIEHQSPEEQKLVLEAMFGKCIKRRRKK